MPRMARLHIGVRRALGPSRSIGDRIKFWRKHEHFRQDHERDFRQQRRSGTRRAPAGTATAPAGSAPAGTAPASVDVAPILDKAVAAKKEKLEWRTSIVDLMKALDIDSSLVGAQGARQGARLQRRHRRFRQHEHLAAQAGDGQARRQWRQGAGRAEGLAARSPLTTTRLARTAGLVLVLILILGARQGRRRLRRPGRNAADAARDNPPRSRSRRPASGRRRGSVPARPRSGGRRCRVRAMSAGVSVWVMITWPGASR